MVVDRKLLILKAIFLQLFWYVAVYYNSIHDIEIFVVAVLACIANFLIFKPKSSAGHYISVFIFFILYGILECLLFNYLGWLTYSKFPLFIISLYVVFLCYYGDILDYFTEMSVYLQSLIGAIGGAFAFWAGIKISGLEADNLYFLGIFFSWGIFFPLSLNLFYGGSMINRILDASIYYSFDLIGYNRHEKQFDDQPEFIKNSTAIVTGGTSGIGFSAAEYLSKNGCQVFITGRNSQKGKAAAESLENTKFNSIDMQSWDKIEAYCDELPELNHIILNAGGMPEKFQQNNYGVESQMASQLFGHYYFIKKLKEKNKLSTNARIVWVSSGGMYLKALDLNTIFENPKYDKVETYANVKRAQVELLDYFQKEFNEHTIVGMHPGWVDTPGVSSAIPGFYKKMKDRLRKPIQGADTILWLLGTKKKLTPGGFYFDRKKVKKNFFFFIKRNATDIETLFKVLQENYKKIDS